MLLTSEIQHEIATWLKANGATYDDLCAKISDDPHDRPSASTVSRWVRGRVNWIQPQLGVRLCQVIGMSIPEDTAGPARLGLSNFSLELAQTIEHLPPRYRARIKKSVQHELMRYMADDNRAKTALA